MQEKIAESTSTERTPLKKLANLWASQSKNGARMLKGKSMDDVSIPRDTKFFIFKNPRKSKENDPDYHLMMSSDEKKEEAKDVFTSDQEMFF